MLPTDSDLISCLYNDMIAVVVNAVLILNSHSFCHFFCHFLFLILTARDCLFLGKHSFNNGYYGQSIEWFEEALIRAHREGNATAPVDEITPFYTMALTIVST